jgi:hypothetical protein
MAGAQLHQRSVSTADTGLSRNNIVLCVAIAALRRCSKRISSVEQAMSLNGVGEKTALKVRLKRRFSTVARVILTRV